MPLHCVGENNALCAFFTVHKLHACCSGIQKFQPKQAVSLVAKMF